MSRVMILANIHIEILRITENERPHLCTEDTKTDSRASTIADLCGKEIRIWIVLPVDLSAQLLIKIHVSQSRLQ